jgi:hypothetical protein
METTQCKINIQSFFLSICQFVFRYPLIDCLTQFQPLQIVNFLITTPQDESLNFPLYSFPINLSTFSINFRPKNEPDFINAIPLSHLVIYDCFISVNSYKFSSTISLSKGKKNTRKKLFSPSIIYNVLAVTSMKANRIINQGTQ